MPVFVIPLITVNRPLLSRNSVFTLKAMRIFPQPVEQFFLTLAAGRMGAGYDTAHDGGLAKVVMM